MLFIQLQFEWWELVLLSPIFGWPGLIIGAIVGAFAWRKRPILGGAIGALVGNMICFYLAVLLM